MSAGQAVCHLQQRVKQHAGADAVMAVIQAGIDPRLLKPLQHEWRKTGFAGIARAISGQMLQHALP